MQEASIPSNSTKCKFRPTAEEGTFIEQCRCQIIVGGGARAKQIRHVHLSMDMHVRRLAKAQARGPNHVLDVSKPR